MASFKTHTDYDLENMEELQRVVGKVFARKQNLGKRAGFSAWGAVCLAVGLYLALQKDSVVLALICCVVGCLLLGTGIFFYQVTAWTALRAMGGNRGGSDFTVDKTGILVVRQKAGARFAYSDCAYLMETRNSLYFVTVYSQGLILDKRQVKGGTAEELKAWLEEQTGKTTMWVGKGKTPQACPASGSKR